MTLRDLFWRFNDLTKPELNEFDKKLEYACQDALEVSRAYSALPQRFCG